MAQQPNPTAFSHVPNIFVLVKMASTFPIQQRKVSPARWSRMGSIRITAVFHVQLNVNFATDSVYAVQVISARKIF